MSKRGSSTRRVAPKYTTNPKTGREIEIGGKTYLDLAKDPKWANKLTPKPTATQRRSASGRSYSNSKQGGCSNQAKYRNLPASDFCGPSGGACPGTFPVNTPGRARAGLSYRRHAPNPAGIEECVIRIAKRKGWYDAKTGTIKVSKNPIAARRPSKRKSNDELSKNTNRRRSTKGRGKTVTHALGCGCNKI